MKVLFAVSNDNITTSVVNRYQQKFKEIITSKNVYYFNAIIKELQKDKTYDIVVIGEDLEPISNNNYDAVDKFIFEKLDSISDEASKPTGEDIPIILICSDRRTKSDQLLIKLFGIGVYNALLGNDRSIDMVCNLIAKPRNKKEAKNYYKIESNDVEYKPETDSDVSESEIQSILAHYKKVGNNEKKCVESFDSIAEQYTDSQLRIIVTFLPISVKAILEANSPRYQQLMTSGTVLTNGKYMQYNKQPVTKPGNIDVLTKDLEKPKLNEPVIIPATMNIQEKLENELKKGISQQSYNQSTNVINQYGQPNYNKNFQQSNYNQSSNVANQYMQPNYNKNTQQSNYNQSSNVANQYMQPNYNKNTQQANYNQSSNVANQYMQPNYNANTQQANYNQSSNAANQYTQPNYNTNTQQANYNINNENQFQNDNLNAQYNDKKNANMTFNIEELATPVKNNNNEVNVESNKDLNKLLNQTPSLNNFNDAKNTTMPVQEEKSSILPGLEETSSVLPGMDETSSVLPGLEETSSVLPGIDETSSVLPGLEETSSVLPGIDGTSNVLPGTDETSNVLPKAENENISANQLVVQPENLLTTMQTNTSLQNFPTEGETIRRRGRPRKVYTGDIIENQVDSTPKRRGRPRKVVDEPNNQQLFQNEFNNMQVDNTN